MVRNTLLSLFAVLLISTNVLAQVTISPVALFMDDQNRFATLSIMNGSNEAQEVSLEFLFGYPDTDENGNTFMNYEDEESEQRYSITDWIRAFPRSMVIPPDQTQTIRLTVRPPAGLEPGTYWTRVKITSIGQAPDLDEPEEEGVGARVQFRFEQVTSAYFKTGDVSTGIEIKNLETSFDDSGNLVALASLARTGNSPYLGTMDLNVYDSANNLVANRRLISSIFFDGKRKLDVDVSELGPGEYTAELVFRTERADVSPSDIIQGEAVRERVAFSLD